MYKWVIWLLSISIIAINVGCNPCKSYTQVPIQGELNDYFSVYQPGNWWTYKNHNGSLNDSIYVVSYTDEFHKDKGTCQNAEEKKFVLESSYLLGGNSVKATFKAVSSQYMEITFRSDKSDFRAALPYFQEDLQHRTISSQPEGPSLNRLDSVIINHKTYYEVLVGYNLGNTYFFSKHKGLVGWTTDQKDTFNLTTFKI